MDCKPTFLKRGNRGVTVAELTISLGLSAIILIAIMSLYLYSSRTFVVLQNHLDLDNASRLSMDWIGQEIRQADKVLSYTTKDLTFQIRGLPVSYFYSPGTRTVMRKDALGTKTVLKDCDRFRFEVFQRTPSNSVFGFFPTSTSTSAKVVRLTWLCSRGVGDLVKNQSTMRSAQVVLRNQTL